MTSPTRADGPRTRQIVLEGPLDLVATLGPLQTGQNDPTMRLSPTTAVRAVRTPDGPVTLRLDLDAHARRVRATAVGAGAEWALATAPALVGAHDDRSGFDPSQHEVVARFDRRMPGLRLTRTGRVVDVLAPTILAQKVTAAEAIRAFQFLTAVADEPAPRDHDLPDLLLPPSARWWGHTPTWQYTAAGVDGTRARTIIETHRRIDRLEEAVAMEPAAARTRLTAIRGIGPWTAAIVERLARGDADAVELGDVHVPNAIAWSLAREPRADDTRMLELLEPFAGHRGRVVRLCGLVGGFAPRRGPRLSPRRFGARRLPARRPTRRSS